VSDRPSERWSLARMAAVAHVTPRHLNRLFRAHVGHTPREYLEGIRFAVAEQALRHGEQTDAAIEAAGIGDARQWRRIRARRQQRGARSP
jgi:transcriptional regulator GlxA family with amidase domain